MDSFECEPRDDPLNPDAPPGEDPPRRFALADYDALGENLEREEDKTAGLEQAVNDARKAANLHGGDLLTATDNRLTALFHSYVVSGDVAKYDEGCALVRAAVTAYYRLMHHENNIRALRYQREVMYSEHLKREQDRIRKEARDATRTTA